MSSLSPPHQRPRLLFGKRLGRGGGIRIVSSVTGAWRPLRAGNPSGRPFLPQPGDDRSGSSLAGIPGGTAPLGRAGAPALGERDTLCWCFLCCPSSRGVCSGCLELDLSSGFHSGIQEAVGLVPQARRGGGRREERGDWGGEGRAGRGGEGGERREGRREEGREGRGREVEWRGEGCGMRERR